MASSLTTRVLLVEKDRIVRELLEVALAHPNRIVKSASTIQQALAIAQSVPAFDVALIECTLSDGQGLALGQQLRSLDAEMELLLMSAAPSLEAVIEAVEAGASEYFPKPFEDINQVALRVGAAEERARLRREGKWLHQALVESEERYRKLFAATPDAVIVHDARTGCIDDVNPAAQALYDYDREQLLGQSVRILHDDSGGSMVEDPRTIPASAAPVGSILRRDRRRDGTPIDVELVVGRLQFRGQDMVVEIIRDIGERLRAQRAHTELEHQLRQAQKLEALGRLAGGVAHDFNNLLAVILNYAQFVMDSLQRIPPHEQLRTTIDDVEQILRASTSATALTRQLLAFSRREVVQKDVVDVNLVVSATERLLRGSLGPRISIVTNLAPDLGRVHVDRGQLEQVLVNLVVNARDAMPNGGQLTIATRNWRGIDGARNDEESTFSEAIELEVHDTGQGIEPAIFDKIFDPFFTTKDRDRGTGLGLAMVKGIVEQAGGSINVTTALGEGSCFSIRLPATADVLAAKPRSAPPLRQPAGGELILVVDDDPAVRRALCRILKGAGYRVIAADSGAQALSELEQHGTAIDVVLTDVLMPGISGEELVQRLRQRQPTLKVIFATGYATSPVVASGDELGQRAVLPKPFDQRRLLEVIAEVIHG